jgi:hypothetical protein
MDGKEPVPSERRFVPAAYVIISTADTGRARKLVALAMGLRRILRIRIGGDEVAYELWLDKLQYGVLTVFPPIVNDQRDVIKVQLDGTMDVTTAHCAFRAFTSREQAIRFFQRHDGTLEHVDDATRGEILIKI